MVISLDDHHIILYYTILYYIILYYTTLYYIILHYTILYYIILYNTPGYYWLMSVGEGPRNCSDVVLARKDSGGIALQWRRVSAKGLAATSSQTRGCSSRICGADERHEISIDCTIPIKSRQISLDQMCFDFGFWVAQITFIGSNKNGKTADFSTAHLSIT